MSQPEKSSVLDNKRDRRESMNGNNRRDINAVSRIVSRNLELFLTDTKREQCFDPTGGRRVQSAGHVICRSAPFACSGGEVHNKQRIQPCPQSSVALRQSAKSPHRNSATNDQATRLTQYANSLLDTRAGSNIAAIRRCRSAYGGDRNVNKAPPIGVQNFRLHFGTALTVDKYIEFYEQQGWSGPHTGQSGRTNKTNKNNTVNTNGSTTDRDPRFSYGEQRLIENYYRKCNNASATSPRYLESSWDVAASVRHQMRSFTVDEIRRMRHADSLSTASSHSLRALRVDDVDHHDNYDHDHMHAVDQSSINDDVDLDDMTSEMPRDVIARARREGGRLGTAANTGSALAVCDVSVVDDDDDDNYSLSRYDDNE